MVAVPDHGDWSPVGLNGAVRGNKLGMNHVDSRLGNVVVGVPNRSGGAATLDQKFDRPPLVLRSDSEPRNRLGVL